MPREYVSCLGKSCLMDDEDDHDGGYHRLENSGSNAESLQMTGTRAGVTAEDYFRPANAYQWSSPTDLDQGQEPMVDQGSHNYTGVGVQATKDKKKLTKRTLRKRIRHFIRVSWKWMKRGFFNASPAVTPQFIMNPALMMTPATVTRQLPASSSKHSIFL